MDDKKDDWFAANQRGNQPAASPREPRETLRDWIRDRLQGQCKMLSLGDECPCALCAFDNTQAEISRLSRLLSESEVGKEHAWAVAQANAANYGTLLDEYIPMADQLASLRAELEEARKDAREVRTKLRSYAESIAIYGDTPDVLVLGSIKILERELWSRSFTDTDTTDGS